MNAEITVAEGMTPFPCTIEEDATLPEARAMMARHKIRHLPVMEGGRLVGLVSDRDLKLAQAMAGQLPAGLTVRDVCVTKPYTVPPDTPLSEVLAEMARRLIGSALVAGHGTLLGIYTSTDACRDFARQLTRATAAP